MTPWLEHAVERLRDAGHRPGGARRAVLETLAEQACCLTAVELYERVRAAGRPVGLASVYRAIEQLAGLGLVQRVDVGDGVARYEPLAADGDHHHHVVCDDCGRVEPFSDDRLERAIHSAGGRVGFAVEAHEVVLRGACGECRIAV